MVPTPGRPLRRPLGSPGGVGEAPVRLLRMKSCRWHGCGRIFVICEACDHGKAFCSPSCREDTRRGTLRAAGQRYQRSERGRAHYRERQRPYRQRQSIRVTHHPGDLVGRKARPRRGLTSPLPGSATTRLRTPALKQCNICGIQSSWFAPFAEPGARSRDLRFLVTGNTTSPTTSSSRSSSSWTATPTAFTICGVPSSPAA